MSDTIDTGLFKPELCFFDWECSSPEDLFCQLDAVLAPRGNVNAGWLEGISQREQAYPTGLRVPTVGLAIPHTDPRYIAEPYIAIVRPKEPVVFDAMAGVGDPVPAQIVINLGITRDGGQVAVLQNIMAIFTDEAKAADVMAQGTPEDLVRTIVGYFE